MVVIISFSKLFILDVEDPTKRMPLENLDDGYAHIHGLLKLEISGNVLPRMGFSGLMTSVSILGQKNCPASRR